jgi:hypothetical protein
MFKYQTALSALTLSLILAASTANAQDANIEELDLNDDGQLSFNEIDTDDDGLLKKSEVTHAFGPAAQSALAKFDVNVTLDEVRGSNNAGGNKEARAKVKERKEARSKSVNDRENGGGNRGSNGGGGKGGGGNGKGGGKGNGRN